MSSVIKIPFHVNFVHQASGRERERESVDDQTDYFKITSY